MTDRQTEVSDGKRVYLAARYIRNPEMRLRAIDLAAIGYDVQAEWITGCHEGTSDDECARIDVEQVRAADIVISFTEEPRVMSNARGGRHVEFGIALALGKRCILVGYRENVFHHLPQVEFYATWDEALAGLRTEASNVR